ncbi:MAG: alpha/beta hydrolase [Taibaiella sp.]|nr:alpha/beta hydrolase [Taibaiella sp.]
MLHYQTAGEGKPVILIHGFPSDHTTWHTIVPALSRSFKLYLPDLPGAGLSEGVAEESLRIEDMARGIRSVIDRENLENVIIAGHSMGGYTAMACLELFPEKIAGLSLIHSLASADSEEKKETRRKSIQLIRKGDDARQRFLKEMAGNLFAASFAAEHPDTVQMVADKGMALSTVALTNFYTAMMHRPDRTAVLKDNGIPVQWIIGTEDKATPPDHALAQAYLAQVNDVHIYDQTGHMSMYEAPDRLLQDLSSFCHFCFNL